jgi:hypothetical protein
MKVISSTDEFKSQTTSTLEQGDDTPAMSYISDKYAELASVELV